MEIKRSKIDKILEAIGVKYFNKLDKSIKSTNKIFLKNVPSDRVLEVISKNITTNVIFLSFLIGAVATVPSVIFEMYYKNSIDSITFFTIWGLITLIFLIMEIGLLYWLAIRNLYTLSYILGYRDIEDELPIEYDVKRMMVRSALELEDPIIEYLGINPQKYVSKKWIVIRTLLYKAKVVLTGIIIKLLLKKISIRYGLRVGFSWVAIPVTAFWDSYVMYKVIKDAKLRLFGHHFVYYLIYELFADNFFDKLKPNIKEGVLRAIAVVMVLAKNYHPNNITFLIYLSKLLDIDKKSNYDNIDIFIELLDNASKRDREFLLFLVSIATIFDGEISHAEKVALKRIFKNEYREKIEFTKELQKLLVSGQIHQVALICKERVDYIFTLN